MKRFAVILASIACTSQPPAHTIGPAPSSSGSALQPTHVDPANMHHQMIALHTVTEAWRVNHANECPTVQRLKDERELAGTASTNDDWGTPYKIVCEDETTRIISYGADRREGTADDIIVPNKE